MEKKSQKMNVAQMTARINELYHKSLILAVICATFRINELYHKSQAQGLTDAEKEEQKQLRSAYVANVRANLRGQLDNISIVEKDGTITDLKDRKKQDKQK